MQDFKNIKAVIFDIDGTLMDSIGRIIECMQMAAMRCNEPKPSDNSCKNIIGLSLRTAVSTLFPNCNDEKVDAITNEYKKVYLELELSNPVSLFESTIPLLQALQKNSIKVGIATGKSTAGYLRVSKYSNFGNYVDVVGTVDTAKSKPAPEMLLKLSSELNLPLEDCLMVGDSTLDIDMANNASMQSVAVLTGVHNTQQLQSSNPTVIVENLEELAKLLGINL